MKKLLSLLLLVATVVRAQKAQPDAVWTQFTKKEKDDYKYGYKDADGRIRIPARFGNFTNAQKFRHIMAVNEDATQKQYYLLKNGRKVGRDSVYMFDYTFDCESEGKIRFQDYKKDRVGFLNIRGQVSIPAIYNYASPFHNGLALVLTGARRTCWGQEGGDTLSCEHSTWQGGREMLINEHNEVVVHDLGLPRPALLNWYSFKLNEAAPDTATTYTFRAVNGDRYTFTDYEKEFTRWFYGVFIPALRTGTAGPVAPLCYSELAVSGKPFRGWQHVEQAAFVQKYYLSALLPKLSSLREGAKNADISSEELNKFIFTSPRFQGFLTDCGEHDREKYPAFSVVVTEVDAKDQKHYDHQQHFAFIRTAQGYRLFSVSL